MITRCSNWHFNQTDQTYQARYQVGFDVVYTTHNQISMIEIKEFLLNINIKEKIFSNHD